VLGSLPQAQAKSLIFVVGGPRPAFDRALPVMKAMGGTVRYAGEAGAGAVVKLAANTMLGLQVAGMAELIGMLERAGVDVAHALDIIGDTPVSSLAAKVNAQFMLAGDHEPRFPVELIEKDMAYSVAASGSAESAPMAEAARQVFRRAMAKGLGGENMTAIAKLYD
jgi:3-hydroxyisobutyrate dehydrogenase-like beta-hydroxyacid dehydrogenase